MQNPFARERSLGVSRTRRRYDLPLNKAGGTGFLTLLIGLMTFLALLALSASFVLSAMTDRWSSGLENRVTIEIPAENEAGKILSSEETKKTGLKIESLLTSHPAVLRTHIMTDEEIRELVKPWLGENLMLGKIPLPGLISAELQEMTPETIQILEKKIKAIHKTARIDTHEEWLGDLLRFTGALQFAAFILALVIGLATITAVAGAVRSHMAVYHAEVELLHLMGAHDSYISRQFQRHSLSLAFQGGLCGVAIGGLCLLIIGWISGEMGVSLLPDFRMGYLQLGVLATLPVFMALISALAARQTVLKVLRKMP
ncbi:MAG: permease [Alphaproteobacteria bacterium CG_4_9_14_3_um_filter_47_13]|nr:MAG: permease [Alphaproteobacteria bacterium CG_4_9_14_3_um_filter_47_13]